MSWKKYGGINKTDKYNNVSVTNLISNSLSLKDSFVGQMDVSGQITVSGNIVTNHDLLVHGNMYNSQNSTFDGDILVYGQSNLIGNVNVVGTFSLGSNSVFNENITVYDNVYLGASQSVFFYGDTTGVGLNTNSPIGGLDIHTDQPIGYSIYTTNTQNKNIIAQNVNNKGIVVETDDQTSSIKMYNDNIIDDPVVDASITYNAGGNLRIDVSNNVQIMSNLTVSDTGKSSHINDETAVIYDNNSGTALSLITKDTNSATFLRMTTEQMNGFAINGGNILGRSGGSFGWTDDNGNYTTGQMIVAGTSPLKYNSTVGINTYSPMVDQYVVDLNGPMHINNGQVTQITTVPYQIIAFFGKGLNIYAAGSPYTYSTPYFYNSLYSSNGGKSFNTIPISSSSGDTIAGASNLFRCGTSYNSQISFIAGDKGYIYYTYNQNQSWEFLSFGGEPVNNGRTTSSLYSTASPINGCIRLFRSLTANTINVYDVPINRLQIGNNFPIYYTNITNGQKILTTGVNNIKSICGINLNIYIAGNGIQYTNSVDDTTTVTFSNLYGSQNTYNAITSYNSSMVVAVGNQIVSYSYSTGTDIPGQSWTDISCPGITFTNLYINSLTNVIAVGYSNTGTTKGIIYYTNDGFKTWNIITDFMKNVDGKSNIFSNSPYFQNVYMTDNDSFIITSTNQPYTNGVNAGNTSIFYWYYPYLFNRTSNTVLDISGSQVISGDINVNEGGKIVSTNSEFYLLNENVNNLHIGENASTITLGSRINVQRKNGNVIIPTVNIGSSMSSSTGTIINLGLNSNDTVYIGKSFLVAKQNEYLNTPQLYLNYTADSETGNGIFGTDYKYNPANSGQYAGVYIAFDKPQSGFIRISDEIQYFGAGADLTNNGGYVFQAPTPGSSNPVYFNTNSMKYPPIYANGQIVYNEVPQDVSGGIMILTPNMSTGNNTVSANYTMTVSNLDIRDVFLKSHSAGNASISRQVITTDVEILGNILINSRKNTELLANGTAAFMVNGGINIGKDSWTQGNQYIQGYIFAGNTTNATSSTTGSLIVSGGVGVSMDIWGRGNVNANGYLQAFNTRNSANYTTGSLVVSGGIGVAKDIWTNGNLYYGTNGIKMGNVSGNYTGIFIDNNGNVGIGNILNPTYALDISGNFHTTNGIYIDGNIFARNTSNSANYTTGSLVVSGGIGVAKDIWTNGNLYYGTNGIKMGNVSGNYTGIFIDNNGNVGIGNILNPSYALDISGNFHTTNGIYIDGNIFARNTSNSANYTTGSLVVSGGIGLAKDIWTNGNLYYGTNGIKMGNVSGNYTGIFIDNNGNVGIGNRLNPQSILHINGKTTIGSTSSYTSSGLLNIYESTGTGPYTQTTSGTTPTPTNGLTGSLVINHNNSGGCSSILFPSYDNSGSDYAYIQYFDNVKTGTTDNESSLLMIGIENDNSYGSNVDRIALYPNNGSGFVGINKLNPQYPLHVYGDIKTTGRVLADNYIWSNTLFMYGDGTNGFIRSNNLGTTLYLGAGNTNSVEITSSSMKVLGSITGQSFNATSDYRIKTNIVSLHDLYYNVDRLEPVYYKNTSINKNDMGFIAHEVQKEYPFLVNGEKDGENLQSINYNGFIALLVKEIQDLKKRVSELENR